MKVFVLGPSRSGKTPFATQVASATGLEVVKASAWVRARFPGGGPARDDMAAREAFVAAITRFSIEELRRDPDACVDHVRATNDLARPSLVEGVRNPFDFAKLFDPREDRAVFLEHTANAIPPTVFESGLAAIRRLLDWLGATGLLPEGRVHEYRFPVLRASEATSAPPPPAGCIASLDAAIEDFVARHGASLRAAATVVAAAPKPAHVHAPIDPIRLHVRKEFCYGMDPAFVGELLPATAFCVSSYPGSTPSVKVLLEDGAVFSYLPPTALVDPARRRAAEARGAGDTPSDRRVGLALEDLAYHDCPSGDVCVHRYPALAGPLLAYLKRRDLWLRGEYLFTMDWYLGNDLLHMVALENGQFAFLPHHKLKFGGGAPGFAPYKKIRSSWSVGPPPAGGSWSDPAPPPPGGPS